MKLFVIFIVHQIVQIMIIIRDAKKSDIYCIVEFQINMAEETENLTPTVEQIVSQVKELLSRNNISKQLSI